MRSFFILFLLSAFIWGGVPLVQHLGSGAGGAAYAKSGSSDDDSADDDDDDDSGGNSGSGSGNSGSGGSGSGSSGSGSSGSGSSGSSGGNTSSGASPKSDAVSTRRTSNFGLEGISIHFADGHVERIRDGRFEALDARGRMVEAHAARRSEINRLREIGSSAKRRGGLREVIAVVEIDDGGEAIEITDFRGWSELIRRGTYIVKDPNGRTVARRPVTMADILRIRGTLGLD